MIWPIAKGAHYIKARLCQRFPSANFLAFERRWAEQSTGAGRAYCQTSSLPGKPCQWRPTIGSSLWLRPGPGRNRKQKQHSKKQLCCNEFVASGACIASRLCKTESRRRLVCAANYRCTKLLRCSRRGLKQHRLQMCENKKAKPSSFHDKSQTSRRRRPLLWQRAEALCKPLL